MEKLEELRGQLARLLDWEDAHVGFDAVIAGIPPGSAERSRRDCRTPPGSFWSTCV